MAIDHIDLIRLRNLANLAIVCCIHQSFTEFSTQVPFLSFLIPGIFLKMQFKPFPYLLHSLRNFNLYPTQLVQRNGQFFFISSNKLRISFDISENIHQFILRFALIFSFFVGFATAIAFSNTHNLIAYKRKVKRAKNVFLDYNQELHPHKDTKKVSLA